MIQDLTFRLDDEKNPRKKIKNQRFPLAHFNRKAKLQRANSNNGDFGVPHTLPVV